MTDIGLMTKTTVQKRDSKTGHFRVAGRATDGVEILVPAARPKHFTFRQIEKTVEMVKSRRALRDGAAESSVTSSSNDH